MKRRPITGLLAVVLMSCSSSRCTQQQGVSPAPTTPVASTTEAASTSSAVASASSPTPTTPPDEDAMDVHKADSPLAAKLEVLRRGGRKTVPYTAPTADEEKAYRAWIALAMTKIDAGQPPPSPPDGFVVESLAGVWVLAEAPGRKRGAGALVLRPKPSSEVVIEAPHTFFDMGTLDIARVAFERSNARALIINTVYRYRSKDAAGGGGGEDEDSGSESDVAHAKKSFFLFAHEELGRLISSSSTVQSHGFSGSKMPGVSAIVSAANTSGAAPKVVAAMRAVAGLKTVHLYPDDIRTLGGTTNVEAGASQRAGRGFVHVEMSAELRDALKKDRPLLERTVDAIVGAVAASKP